MRTRSSSRRWSSVLLALVLGAGGAAGLTGTAAGAGTSANATDTTWNLVWSDEFDGPAIDRNKWDFEHGAYIRNEELQYYTDREKNARIENGQLLIEGHREDFGGRQYTSASLITKYKYHFRYGRFEMRAKLPSGVGAWPAFWTLGVEGHPDPNACHPATGEIDIMEFVGGDPASTSDPRNREAWGVAHWDEGNDPACSLAGNARSGDKFTLASGMYADDYHVFRVDWTPTRITWFMDGQQFHSLDITAATMSELHQFHYLLLNLAIGGTWPGSPEEGKSTFPMQYYVDWVRVYADPSIPPIPLNPGGDNKLANPGLESGSTGWSNVSGNWSVVQPDPAYAKAGSSAFKSVSTQEWGSGGGPFQHVTGIPANTDYVASFWLKGRGFVQLVLYDGSWGRIAARRCGAASGTWTLCSYSFNTGSNTSMIFQLQDHSVGTVYVDEAYLGTAATSPPPPPPSNLLRNPGLEEGASNWNGVTGSWSVVQLGTGNARSGSWALQASSTQQWGSGGGPSQAVSGVTPNTTYVASAWLKGTGVLQVVVYDGGWGYLNTARCTATSSWTPCSVSVDSGSATGLIVQLQDHAAGTAHVDDLYLGR